MAVDLQLHGVGLVVGPLDGRLVQLQFEVVVVAEDPLVPADRLLGLLQITGRDGARHLARQTGRAADQPLVVLLDLGAVGARTHVETVGPRLRDDLDEVVVSLEVLGQQDQVVAALVLLALLVLKAPPRDIDLAADDGLEVRHGLEPRDLLLRRRRVEAELLLHAFDLLDARTGRGAGLGILGRVVLAALQRSKFLLELPEPRGGVAALRQQLFEPGREFFQRLDLVVLLAVLFLDVVVELLDTEHVAVVRHGDAGLTVGHGLVHQTLDAGLSVEDRILRMYVKMNEFRHGIQVFPGAGFMQR